MDIAVKSTTNFLFTTLITTSYTILSNKMPLDSKIVLFVTTPIAEVLVITL